jgi:hypothetical protein
MLCERFAESWFNGRHTVARRKLRPFNLWHYTYLDLVESPLAVRHAPSNKPSEKIGWPEIIQAARICQLGYEEVLSVESSWKTKLELFLAMAQSTDERELNAFYRYVNDYYSPPRFNEWGSRDHPGRPKGSPPDALSVASAVIMMFGGGPSAEKYVWEMPIGKAFWYSSTLHYNRGADLDYMTARDEAFRKFLRQQRAEGKI